MPTSIDSAPGRRAEPTRRKPRALAAKAMTSDPADPRNANKPLGQLRDEESQDVLSLESSGLWNDDLEGLEDVVPKARFWDASSILAVSLSFVCGSVAGVPLGHYLYSIWS